MTLMSMLIRENRPVHRRQVNLRIYPLDDGPTEIRFWREGRLIDIQKVKNSDLKGVRF